MKTCSEPGCDGEVVARGLCARHYQRWRRGSKHDAPGRPRTYPRQVTQRYQGTPVLSARLEPELWKWAQERGGGAWLKHLVSELRALSEEKAFARFWERLRLEEGEEFVLLEQDELDQLAASTDGEVPGERVGHLWRIRREDLEGLSK